MLRIIKKHYLLLLPLLVGLVLYFYRLGDESPGFYIDEAMYGYSAYSLYMTGMDEWGKSWPMFFRFFGLYSPPVYTYLVLLSSSFLGFSIFSVRFIAALSGLFTIVGIYILVIVMTKNKSVALASAAIMSVSPWLMIYARTGFEVATAMTLLLFGVVACYLGLKDFRWNYLSCVLLSLSMYTAIAERLLIPIFAIVYLVVFRKQIFKPENKKNLMVAIALVFVLQLPHLWLLSTPAFLPKGSLMQTSDNLIREFFSQYVSYFSPASLFFRSDPDMQRSMPELSVFYPWMVVPYLVGWWLVLKDRSKKYAKYLFVMLLTFPIPAALTHDPFASHRASPLLLPIVFLIGMGVVKIIEKLNKKASFLLLISIFLFSLLMLWRSCFILMPLERSRYWMVGYERLSEIIRSNPDTHFLIDQGRLKPAYMNIGFLLPVDPREFQRSVDQRTRDNYYHWIEPNLNFEIDQLSFRSINWKVDECKAQIIVGDVLSVSDGQALEHGLHREFEIKDLKGDLLLVGWKTNPPDKCLID